jgi:hypothetical protein
MSASTIILLEMLMVVLANLGITLNQKLVVGKIPLILLHLMLAVSVMMIPS